MCSGYCSTLPGCTMQVVWRVQVCVLFMQLAERTRGHSSHVHRGSPPGSTGCWACLCACQEGAALFQESSMLSGTAASPKLGPQTTTACMHAGWLAVFGRQSTTRSQSTYSSSTMYAALHIVHHLGMMPDPDWASTPCTVAQHDTQETTTRRAHDATSPPTPCDRCCHNTTHSTR